MKLRAPDGRVLTPPADATPEEIQAGIEHYQAQLTPPINAPLPSAPTSPSPLSLQTGGISLGDVQRGIASTPRSPGTAALVMRTVPPIVGGVIGSTAGPIGAAVGAGVGGLVGGTLAQEQEIAAGAREDFNPWRLGADVVTSLPMMVPGISAIKPPVLRGIVRALQGGITSLGAGAATNLSEGIPVTENAVRNFTLGAGIGGVAGLSEYRATVAATKQAAATATIKQAQNALVPPVTTEMPEAAPATLEALGVGLNDPPGTLGLPRALAERSVAEQATEAIADTTKQGGVATAQALAATDAAKHGQRLYRRIADAFANGDIDARAVTDILQREQMSLADFIIHYRQTISTSGRKLQFLSSVQRQLNKMAQGNPQLAAALEAVVPQKTWMGKLMERGKDLLDFRRAAIVSGLATFSRNVQSQAGATFVNAVDMSIDAAMEGRNPLTVVSQFGGATTRAAQESVEDLVGVFKVAKPPELRQIERILDGFPVEAQRFLATPAAEGALGRVGRFINTHQSVQETFYRRLALDAYVRGRLAQEGHDVLQALSTPGGVPEEIVHDGVDFALRSTFASMPRSQTGKNLMKVWHFTRPLSDTIQPFPRFMGAAYGWLIDHSPAGYLRLMGVTFDQKVYSNPERMRQVLSRAHVGTLMLAGALAIRNSDSAGEKWWEVKRGVKSNGEPKYWDLRPFAPFSTHLFYAELIRQMSTHGETRMTTQDWMQGLLSINRIAGTGLVAVDLLRSGSMERSRELVGDMVSQYIGGFTVPMVTIKDVLAEVQDPHPAIKDLRGRPYSVDVPWLGQDIPVSLGPAMRNLPGIEEKLSEFRSPLRSGAIRPEVPGWRQLTGFSYRTKNIPEMEVDRLAIESAQISPTSGVPEYDRMVAEGMAPIVERMIPMIVGSPQYRSLGRADQKMLYKRTLRAIRKASVKNVLETRPDLGALVRLKRLDQDVEDMLSERGVALPR